MTFVNLSKFIHTVLNMKNTFNFLFLKLLLTLVFCFHMNADCYVLRDYEVACANKSGIHRLTSEDVYWYTECPNTSPVHFQYFCFCVLENEGILNKDGKLIPEKYEELNAYNINMLRIVRRVPVELDKHKYAQKIHRAIHIALFHKVPTYCKDGNFNYIWEECRLQNNLPKMSLEDLRTYVEDEKEPSEGVKNFVRCGLQKDMFLTVRNILLIPKLSIHAHFRHVLKELKDVQSNNKSDYAWQVFKILWSAK